MAQFGENWKFENMGMNPRKFVLYFLKIEQDWEVFFYKINCCREISYIFKVKIHVKWGRNKCSNRIFDLGYGGIKTEFC